MGLPETDSLGLLGSVKAVPGLVLLDKTCAKFLLVFELPRIWQETSSLRQAQHHLEHCLMVALQHLVCMLLVHVDLEVIPIRLPHCLMQTQGVRVRCCLVGKQRMLQP